MQFDGYKLLKDICILTLFTSFRLVTRFSHLLLIRWWQNASQWMITGKEWKNGILPCSTGYAATHSFAASHLWQWMSCTTVRINSFVKLFIVFSYISLNLIKLPQNRAPKEASYNCDKYYQRLQKYVFLGQLLSFRSKMSSWVKIGFFEWDKWNDIYFFRHRRGLQKVNQLMAVQNSWQLLPWGLPP